VRDGVWGGTIPGDAVTTRGVLRYVEAILRDGTIVREGSHADLQPLPVFGTASGTVATTAPGASNGWNVIAPSIVPGDSGLSAVFGHFGVFGADWVAWRWNPTAGQWEAGAPLNDHPVAQQAEFDLAQPWWVAVDGDGGDVGVPVAGASVDASGRFSIPLTQGWNSIAHPFDFPVPWTDDSIRIFRGGEETSASDAAARDWVDNRAILWSPDSSSYETYRSDDAAPYNVPEGRGIWIFANVGDAELLIEPLGPPDDSEPIPLAPSTSTAARLGLWSLPLHIESASGSDRAVAVVLSDGAMADASIGD
jgi:hypothetical protein